MPVSTNNPIPAPQKVSMLGSGSGTWTETNANDTIATLNIPGDLLSKEIIIHLTLEYTNDASFSVGLGTSLNAAPLSGTTTNATSTNTIAQGRYILTKNVTTPTTTNCALHNINLSGATAATLTAVAIDCSTVEQIFLNTSGVTAASTFNYHYIAYIIG